MPRTDKEKSRIYSRLWSQRNPDKVKLYRERGKLRAYQQMKVRRKEIKFEVLSHYSNGIPQCARCRTVDVDVLCLDHIEGGGTKDRMDTRHWGAKLHYYLRRNNFPEGYQVLCANCNMKKFIVEGK